MMEYVKAGQAPCPPHFVSFMRTDTMHTHLGGGRVTLLADPAISRLLWGFLQRGVQTPKVIAEPALVTPETQSGRACVTSHINKLSVFPQ